MFSLSRELNGAEQSGIITGIIHKSLRTVRVGVYSVNHGVFCRRAANTDITAGFSADHVRTSPRGIRRLKGYCFGVLRLC